MVSHRLVLWDIDHTLIETGGVGREVFAAAFEAVTDMSMKHMAEVSGRTELVIFRETLELHGLSPSQVSFSEFARFQARGYLERSQEMRVRGRVLPGAADALEAVGRLPGVVQSVLTGNTRAAAEAKLKIFALDCYLDLGIGSYGEDDAVRAALVPIAQHRARQKLGFAFTRHSTLLIGDTPEDVIAARNGGARVIAVASGKSSLTDLKKAHPDIVLRDLTDSAALVEAIHELLPPAAP